jgi:NDP-4-keto-2,6-dideoxyhexose 3-C-methyltransferase
MEIVSVEYNEVNGGSMRVLARRAVEVPLPYVPVGVPAGAPQEFAERVRKWKQLMGWILDSSDMSGMTVWCYGASTKGTVLLQYLGRNERIMAVAERNPKKHGLYMVGSWLPITSESEMRRSKPNLLLVLPWAFRDEFVQRERATRGGGSTMLFPLPNPEFVL